MPELLLYLYAVMCLLVILATLKVVADNLRTSSTLFRAAFSAVALGHFFCACKIALGMTAHVPFEQWIISGGALGVFCGMILSHRRSLVRKPA